MPEQILEDVYDLTCGELGGMRFRSYLLDVDRPILVDTAYDRLASDLISEVEATGITPRPWVKALREYIFRDLPEEFGGTPGDRVVV